MERANLRLSMKRIAVVLPVLLLLGMTPQDKKRRGEGYDWVTNTKLGFLVFKPARDEEWEVRDKGTKFPDSAASVHCRVKDLSIDILVEEVDVRNLGFKQVAGPKKRAEDMIKRMKADSERYKEVKVISNKRMKFPGTRDNAHRVVLDVTDKNDRKYKQDTWLFQSMRNKNLFQIVIIGDREGYKKYRRKVSQVLGRIQTLKIKR